MKQWLLLVYQIPRKPTAGRVFVWRKLKQIGAVLLQDAVWVLPETARSAEQFQWLAAEITELGGEAMLWRSQLTSDSQEKELVQRFQSEVDTLFREILQALKRKRPDLATLSRKYQQAVAKDYFQSTLGRRARAALLAARGRMED